MSKSAPKEPITLMGWLDQFPVEDRELALDLHNSLTIVGIDKLHEGLDSLIGDLHERRWGTMALFPARKGTKDYFGVGKKYREKRPRTFAVKKGGGVGSEATLANLLTNQMRVREDVLVGPTLNQMAEHKVRHIVLVDDIVGSGKRAGEFVRSIGTNPTIRSWTSGGYLTFHYLAYAMSEAGERVLRRQRYPSVRHQYLVRPTLGRELWEADRFQAMVDLCKRTASRTGNQWMKTCATGFGDAFAMMLFTHSCPNNLPSMFWHSCPGWRPLFKKRGVHSMGARSIRRVEERLHEPPGRAALDASHDTLNGRLLLALSRRIWRRSALLEFVGITSPALDVVIAECISAGLITPGKHRLTAKGWGEVRAFRSKGPKRGWIPPLKHGMYFPVALRGASDS